VGRVLRRNKRIPKARLAPPARQCDEIPGVVKEEKIIMDKAELLGPTGGL